ncbi:hypothetical protein DFH09DRAFT_966230 [Mycena vulgaris]|nr:hypothetical protein DFH09DRAFT_966230 [Mycena vulgaris]
MSDNSLPDEIISEILSPALKVSDEVFSDTSKVSPFAGYSESTSAYLLVCKSWLRVATPLLYNVVILRSKAQAKALGQVLSKNKDLGKFIKKLRVEGGYGAPMGVILQSSPHISDLFISFEIWSSDNTGGLCKGLSFINPMRLIIRDLDYKRLENKMAVDLEDALAKAILQKWNHLTICDLPYADWGAVLNGRVRKIVEALAKSRRLKRVMIPSRGASWAHSALKDCPLQAIEIKAPVSKYYVAHFYLDNNPTLKALLKFTEESPVASDLGQASSRISVAEHPHIVPSLNPFFIPMNTETKEIQDIIWTRILYFSMSVPELAQNPTHRILPSRLSPLLVGVEDVQCELALPHLYANIRLATSGAAFKVSNVLLSNPSLGPLVRNICDTNYRYLLEPDADSETSSLSTLLSQTTGLVRFCGSQFNVKDLAQTFFYRSESSIPWVAFEAMVRSSGRTLREYFHPVGKRHGVSADIFSGLTQLRSLDWECETSFKLVDGHGEGLSKLEELRIWHQDPSFLAVLSRMKLPSLRRLLLCRDGTNFETFLKAHGSKLTELSIRYSIVEDLKVNIFDVCPNLASLTFAIDPLTVRPNLCFPRIRRTSLYLLGNSAARWKSSPLTCVAKWVSFFEDFEPTHFPNLREIEFPSFEWPTSEREIAKSHWVRWAEDLLKHNINLTDKHGKKWRLRLQAKR